MTLPFAEIPVAASSPQPERLTPSAVSTSLSSCMPLAAVQIKAWPLPEPPYPTMTVPSEFTAAALISQVGQGLGRKVIVPPTHRKAWFKRPPLFVEVPTTTDPSALTAVASHWNCWALLRTVGQPRLVIVLLIQPNASPSPHTWLVLCPTMTLPSALIP